MSGQVGDNGSPAPLLMTSPSRIHQSASRLVLPGLNTGVDGNDDVNANDEPIPASQRQLFAELEPELSASEQEAEELRERKRKLLLVNLILERSNRGFVERVSRALIASIGCAEITLNATNAGVFNDLPKNQKLKLSRRETRSTSTTIHQKKKSKNASKVRNFLIRPPKASQSLTSAQRTSLENFGLQKGMIRRATYLYFW
jgi:hypothetical protein